MTILSIEWTKRTQFYWFWKKEDYNHRLYQALLSLPISLLYQVKKSKSTSSLGASLTLGLHNVTLFSIPQVYKNFWAILRPSIKSLQLLLIGEGEGHCCPSLSTSLEWKRLRCFLDLHAFASLGVQSSMAMTNNELVLLQFPLWTDSFVRESRRFKSFSALFSQFKLKTRVTRPSSVNRAFP